MTERWTDETLDRFTATVATAIQANHEAISANAQAIATSHARLTRIEQVVESNNRFLKSFSQDVKRIPDNMDRLTQQFAANGI